MLAVVAELAADGMTLMMVTQAMRFAHEVCDRVLFMRQGRVDEIGSSEEAFARPQTPEPQRFLGIVQAGWRAEFDPSIARSPAVRRSTPQRSVKHIRARRSGDRH